MVNRESSLPFSAPARFNAFDRENNLGGLGVLAVH